MVSLYFIEKSILNINKALLIKQKMSRPSMACSFIFYKKGEYNPLSCIHSSFYWGFFSFSMHKVVKHCAGQDDDGHDEIKHTVAG